MSTPVAELLFTDADATPMSTDESTIKNWDDAVDQLAAAATYWLATSCADGRPHVQPVLGVWNDGVMYVSTRPRSVKSRNLSRDGRCVVTVSTDYGDLVVEGAARRIEEHEQERLEHVVALFDDKYEWRLSIRAGRLYEDGLPSQPEYVFDQIVPTKAFGYGPDGLTATRWRFE